VTRRRGVSSLFAQATWHRILTAGILVEAFSRPIGDGEVDEWSSAGGRSARRPGHEAPGPGVAE
jgi:hypothetical protein